jgi:urocanate hydratase
MKELFSEHKSLPNWFDMVPDRIAILGLAARFCWFGFGDLHKAGPTINKLDHTGELFALVVIRRDPLDLGLAPSPNREIALMTDGSDVVSENLG